MKNKKSEAKCAICAEPAKHKLKDQPWCGNTPCYFKIATPKAAGKARKTDDG